MSARLVAEISEVGPILFDFVVEEMQNFRMPCLDPSAQYLRAPHL